ncbi:hypothetical protein RhiirC2_787034 [Rhizophagus irregularis]|uniref:Uncharacterized protein n=1 Tax=Rhizophagus irregularis TaxID=588596 RepID=A0A2N1MT01_9GLOM|nr:hypothetical protein RhiirC2_787034 [Rhizophagus irregularis]
MRSNIYDDTFNTNQAEQNDEKNEPHYRATLVYSYPSKFDNIDVESNKVKVDDNDPASVIEHSILGLGANNVIQDADKLFQALLKYTENTISFIEEYEKETLKRTFADVKSRTVTFKISMPVGPFGIFIRDSILKFMNVMINIYSLADSLIKY